VTPRLREAYAEGDDGRARRRSRWREAALASLRLLAGAAEASEQSEETLPPRRAVLVADVGDVTLRPDLDDAVVRIGAPVTTDDVVAVFVDNDAAEAHVQAAIAVIDAADPRVTRDAEFDSRRRAGPRHGLVCHSGAAVPARTALGLATGP